MEGGGKKGGTRPPLRTAAFKTASAFVRPTRSHSASTDNRKTGIHGTAAGNAGNHSAVPTKRLGANPQTRRLKLEPADAPVKAFVEHGQSPPYPSYGRQSLAVAFYNAVRFDRVPRL